MLSNLFIDSVQEAVSQSTTKDLCLVVYNTDSDPTTCDGWLKRWFHLNNDETLRQLKDMAIWLKLVKGSQQLQYFEQIFPGVVIPSMYLIYRGEIKLILMDDPNDSLDTVKGYWDQLLNALKEMTPRMDISHIDEENPTTASTVPKPTPVEKTFKEQVEETAQEMYKEKVAKERKLDREERERILRLVRADKEERKAREHERQVQKTFQPTGEIVVPDLEVHDNIKNKELLHSQNCILQIKLTNGKSIKHTFTHDNTLDEVRKWVDQNRTDDDVPYAFHRSIPRYTYQESDELKTLETLELTPRSLLILKPLESRTQPLNVTEVENPGLFGKVYNSFSALWGSNNTTNTINDMNAGSLGPISQHDSDLNLTDNSIINPGFQTANNNISNSRFDNVNNTSRSITPNVFKFHNEDDNIDEDKEKETYNGNAIKLEKRKKDEDEDSNNK